MISTNYSEKLQEIILKMWKRDPSERPPTDEILNIAYSEQELLKKKKVINTNLIIDDIWHKLELLDFRKNLLIPLNITIDKHYLNNISITYNNLTRFQFLIYITEWCIDMLSTNFLPENYTYIPKNDFSKEHFMKLFENLKKLKIKFSNIKLDNLLDNNIADFCLFINEIITSELIKRNYIFKEPIFNQAIEVEEKKVDNDYIKEEMSDKSINDDSFEDSIKDYSVIADNISIKSSEVEKLDVKYESTKKFNFNINNLELIISKINKNLENTLNSNINLENSLNNYIDNKNIWIDKNTKIKLLQEKIELKVKEINNLEQKYNTLTKNLEKINLKEKKNNINIDLNSYKSSINNLKIEILHLNKKSRFINTILFSSLRSKVDNYKTNNIDISDISLESW